MSELLIPFLSEVRYRVLHQRIKHLNIPVFIRSLRRGFSLKSYLHEYACHVNPSIVVSLLDNELLLYGLKEVLPHARIIAIQNGWRGITHDIFGMNASQNDGALKADDILVFGPAVGQRFESLVDTRSTPIGSFKSNLVPIQKTLDSRVIALVSTVRQKVDLEQYVPVGNGLSTVKYHEIFERRLDLARYVYEFARREGFHLRILGKDEHIGREFDMYQQRLGVLDDTWSFTPRTTLLANYSEIDRAHAVVSSSSTLGYEALGRGARSAFFMIDFEVLHDEGTRFGWPLQLPDNGPFWTHTLSMEQVEQVLKNVVLANDDQWKSMSHDIAAQLVTFDPNNTTFTQCISGP